jgi:hypothetical protein
MPRVTFMVRITGLLAVHASGLRRHLLTEGYTPSSVASLLALAEHLSRWLRKRAISLRRLTPSVADRFVRHRRRGGYANFVSPRGL